jgi:methylmalonyl-CoA mutase cobalamin-binding domain/chain
LDFTPIQGKVFYRNQEIGFTTAGLEDQNPSYLDYKTVTTPSWSFINSLSRIGNEVYLHLGTIVDRQAPPPLPTRETMQEHLGTILNVSPKRPMCAGLALFQKLLFENVIFDPNQVRLTDSQNLHLIEELLLGKTIVVPGYGGAREFTASLDQSRLSDILFAFHQKHFFDVSAAVDQEAHVIGLSILSGSHIPLITETLERMRAAGLGHIPLVVGGIIPEDDASALRAMGVAAVYTPKDFELNRIMLDIVGIVDAQDRAA